MPTADETFGVDANGVMQVADATVGPAWDAPTAGKPVFSRVNGLLPTGFNAGGINTGLASPSTVASITVAMHGTILRQAINWAKAQNSQQVTGACPIHWKEIDNMYRSFVTRGVRPLWNIADAPNWANRLCLSRTHSCGPDAAHVVDYVNFVRLIAHRYPLSAAVEVWNEPNLQKYWDHPDPSLYSDLLAATWNGLQADHSPMRVLGGALSCLGSENGTADSIGLGPQWFLTVMRTKGVLGDPASGIAAAMHALSIHPYEMHPDGYDYFTETFRKVDEVLETRNIRLVVDELGAPVGPDYTLQSSCETLARQYKLLDRQGNHVRRFEDVDAVLFHSDMNSHESTASNHDGYGFGEIENIYDTPVKLPTSKVIDRIYYRRPVYREMARAFGVPEAPNGDLCGDSLDAAEDAPHYFP